MAARHPLNATKRDVFGKKINKHRKEGQIPANIYGSEIESTPLWLDEKEVIMSTCEPTGF